MEYDIFKKHFLNLRQIFSSEKEVSEGKPFPFYDQLGKKSNYD